MFVMRAAPGNRNSAPAAWLVPVICCLAMLGMLTACGSAPVHYYTLVSPDKSELPKTSEVGQAGFDFTLGSVNVPAQIDRAGLVLRNSSGQITVIENEQWVGPVGDELRSAFSVALTRRLQASDVTSMPKNPLRKIVQLTVDVQRFDLYSGHTTTLGVVWSARIASPGGLLIATCKVSIDESVPSDGYAALVEGQQRAINAVSTQIAFVLESWNSGGSLQCPAEKQTAGLQSTS